MENFLKSVFETVRPGVLEPHVAFLAGVAFALLLLILLMAAKIVIRLFFASGKSAGINISGESGSVFISANAVYELIRALEPGFQFLNFRRVTLLDRKKGHALDIEVVFSVEGGAFMGHIDKLKAMIKESLKDTFGVESVSEINVRVRGIAGNHPSAC